MNLNQLYYFKTLARLEHYTKASQELYISQPSLTHAIKELERELGVELFEKGRNVKLSPEGKKFLKYVSNSLTILEDGVDEIRKIHKNKEETMEIGIIPTMVNAFFAPIVKEIKSKKPALNIKFRTGKTLEIIQGVKNNQYDFGICSKINEPELTYLPLLYEELVLITSKNHPLSKLKQVTKEDIVKYPFITYRKEISIYKTIMDYFKNEPLNIIYQLDDETSIASMVSLGFGVAIVANNECLKPFDNIEIIHCNLQQESRVVYLVYNPYRKLPQTTQEVVDYIVKNNLKL